uniref:Secreted protein n=1 Tax=Trichogramma kaykai TaxID=54128 RepID=A0ABD2W885_9HYME
MLLLLLCVLYQMSLSRETTISGNFVTIHDDISELCTLDSIYTYVGHASYVCVCAWTRHMYELPRSLSFSVRTAMMNDTVIERLSARTTDKPRGASERKSKLAASAAASFASSQHHEGGLLLLYLQNSRLICDIFRHCITRSSSNSPSRPRELTPALLCSPVPFHGAWLYGRAFTLPLLVSVPRQIRTPDFLPHAVERSKVEKARMSETRTGRWGKSSWTLVLLGTIMHV